MGFNAVHLYAESFDASYPTNGSTAPGYSAANVDSIVAATRTNGLYLVMTIGNGANNGNYNLAYVTNFWKFYAARYANETHVLFEVQNEPVAWGPSYLTASTPPGGVNMEIAAYRTIRTYAPNTPVLLFTYAVFNGSGGASAALTDIHAFNTTVFGNANAVWTNEAVAFHGYGAGWQSTSTAASNLITAGYPCVMTEYAGSLWGSNHGSLDAEMTSEFERLGISWLTFQHVPPTGVSDDITQSDVYSNIVVNSGLSWTPDYGNFPAVRGPYGNGGQPRTVPASYVNNFLTGTPMRVQAEDFDTGGEGVAYHELTTTNLSGQYRLNEAVDIETTTDTGGGYDVTSNAAGEWLEYSIWIKVAGYYNFSLRYAAPSNGCVVQMTGNGHDRTGRWGLPSTGSATTWMTATQRVLLEPGRQKLRINILNGGFNLNWFELTPSATGFVPNGVYKFLNGANGSVFTEMTSTNLVASSNYVGSAYQQWNLQHIGGGQYKISAVANNWSWNLNNSGSLGITSGWGTGDHQCFILVPTSGGYYRILPVNNGMPLESANANTVDQQAYSGAANQQWALTSVSAPAFPVGLKAGAISATQVSVSWNAVSNATSYKVKRSATSGGPYSTVAVGITGTNYTDTIPVGMTYYYVVSAVTSGSESPNSFEVSYLPYPWATQDIGTVNFAGSASYNGGIFTAVGAGADIWGTADAMRYTYVPVTGNCTMIARVVSVQNVDAWSKAGIMIRSSLNANAANAFISVTPGNGVTWQYRTSNGGSTGNSATGGINAPYWVKLVRSGSTFTGYRSPNGVTWTQQGSAQTISMASTVFVGLALTSHNANNLCTAEFDNVSGPGWTTSAAPAAPAALAAVVTNWNVSLTWPTAGGATSYNVKRGLIFGGPYTVIANVTGTNYIDSALANGTDYYYVVSALNPAGESADSVQASVAAQNFAPSGLTASAISSNQVSLVWNAFIDATSYNIKSSPTSGGPYTTIASGVIGTSYTDTVAVGMKYYYVVSAVTEDAETPNSTEAAINLPYPWQTQDVGVVGVTGSAGYNNGAFLASGAGADIQGTADAFRYVYVPANGDCTIIARVVSVQNINAWSKAGVMIRESLSPSAVNAFVGVTPGNGVTWQYRSATSGATTYNNTTALSAPYWVKLVRSGNTFTGYRSADGVTWTVQGTSTFTMAASVYVGLALSSHDTANLDPAVFVNVTTTGWPAASPPPTPTNISATAISGSRIDLNWNSSASATGYNIKRAPTTGGPYTIISSGVAGTNYSDTGLLNTNSYYYVISALNPSGESGDSSEVSAMTLAGNTAPSLALIPNQNVGVGVTLNWTNSATDVDVPAQALTFSLLSAPTNAAIDPVTGVLTWRPLVGQSGTTNAFSVMVADNGTPSLSATQSFVVTVNPLAKPQLSTQMSSDGKFVIQLTGDTGPDYAIQASTNFVDWNTVFTTNSPTLPITWTNDTGGASFIFYRVVVGPPIP